MKQAYKDIINRITDPILWWDECGVPRFDAFKPGMQLNIYADEIALVEIQCQSCAHPFTVAISRDSLEDDEIDLATRIREGSLYYGDPPNFCCEAGPSMSSIPQRVLQYWRTGRFPGPRYVQVPELEIEISGSSLDDGP